MTLHARDAQEWLQRPKAASCSPAAAPPAPDGGRREARRASRAAPRSLHQLLASAESSQRSAGLWLTAARVGGRAEASQPIPSGIAGRVPVPALLVPLPSRLHHPCSCKCPAKHNTSSPNRSRSEACNRPAKPAAACSSAPGPAEQRVHPPSAWWHAAENWQPRALHLPAASHLPAAACWTGRRAMTAALTHAYVVYGAAVTGAEAGAASSRSRLKRQVQMGGRWAGMIRSERNGAAGREHSLDIGGAPAGGLEVGRGLGPSARGWQPRGAGAAAGSWQPAHAASRASRSRSRSLEILPLAGRPAPSSRRRRLAASRASMSASDRAASSSEEALPPAPPSPPSPSSALLPLPLAYT